MIRLIGDVHGKYEPYKKIIKNGPPSIQVGDMGVGFFRSRFGEPYPMENPPHRHMKDGHHRFIRGNHDNPAVCRRHSQYIKDGTIENDIMFVGGALSIDRQWRTEGYDWWPDEELSIAELNVMYDIYVTCRPRIMVTHDCPESAADAMLKLTDLTKFNIPSRTRQAFQAMFETYQPELWLHGHWHVSCDHVLDGTRFICLAELEYRDIEV